jgi:WD40 repeat protein
MRGEAFGVLRGHRDEVTSVAIGVGGIVLSTSEDATARLWSLDGELLAVLEGHGNDVVAGAIAPDGLHVAPAALDGTARVWQISTARQTAAMVEHDGQGVVDVAFDDTGSRVVTAGDDGTARIWSAVTGERLAVLRGHTDEVLAADFDADGDGTTSSPGAATPRCGSGTRPGRRSRSSPATRTGCGTRPSTIRSPGTPASSARSSTRTRPRC